MIHDWKLILEKGSRRFWRCEVCDVVIVLLSSETPDSLSKVTIGDRSVSCDDIFAMRVCEEVHNF